MNWLKIITSIPPNLLVRTKNFNYGVSLKKTNIMTNSKKISESLQNSWTSSQQSKVYSKQRPIFFVVLVISKPRMCITKK